MPDGGLSVYPFTGETLRREFGANSSAEYLTEYLTTLGAGACLVEHHYVDRHYLDDYTHYYARSFSAPTPECARFHFFSLPQDQVEGILASAFTSKEAHTAAEERLQEKYLGFVVKRPLEGARVGRTVLKTYPADNRRQYTVVRPYRVNIVGLELQVDGLAYQQQDGGAAVCASTALWSALQRVARVAGHRTPTPAAVTRAAASPYPASHGLDTMQMAAALSSLGYLADAFGPAENRQLFRAKVAACLQSQLPVVLLMSRLQETGAGMVTVAHAVTLTGYSEPSTIENVPSPMKGQPPYRLRTASIDVVYAHDDNLGSHAHYELFDSTELNASGHPKQMLLRGRRTGGTRAWWTPDEWEVESVLVPKPDKLRLSVESLFESLLALRQLMDLIFPGLELHFAPRFAAGVEYRRSLLGQSLDPSEMQKFQRSLTLPRFVGVVSAFHQDFHLCDVVLDVSEVSRRDSGLPTIIAIVAPGVHTRSIAWVKMNAVTKALNLDVPMIFAGISPPSPPQT